MVLFLVRVAIVDLLSIFIILPVIPLEDVRHVDEVSFLLHSKKYTLLACQKESGQLLELLHSVQKAHAVELLHHFLGTFRKDRDLSFRLSGRPLSPFQTEETSERLHKETLKGNREDLRCRELDGPPTAH